MEVTTGEEGQCPGRAGPGAEVARSRTAVCLLRVWERARALTMAVPPATTPRPPPGYTGRTPHLMPESATSNSMRRTSWKWEGPVTRWLVTMRARKGRCSEGGLGGSAWAACGSDRHGPGAS